MKHYSGEANVVYPQLLRDLLVDGTEMPSRVSVCKELHPVIIELTDTNRRVIIAPGRLLNVAFAYAEVAWIILGRNDVAMLKYYNSSIDQFSDDGTTFNAAYGYRMRRNFGIDQIANVVDTLREEPDSRQATIVLSDPWEDRHHRATKDRACNIVAHLMIRQGRLDWMQIIRSNDAVWGTPYNWIQWLSMQDYIAHQLGVPVGRYFHIVDSMHVYDYHYTDAQRVAGAAYELKDALPEVAMGSFPVTGVSRELQAFEAWLRLEEPAEDLRWLSEAHELMNHLRGWERLAATLWTAHRLYKEHQDGQCIRLLLSGPWLNFPAECMAQIRFYWGQRWSKQEHSEVNAALAGLVQPLQDWVRAC